MDVPGAVVALPADEHKIPAPDLTHAQTLPRAVTFVKSLLRCKCQITGWLHDVRQCAVKRRAEHVPERPCSFVL
jgi:hypothetical protein